MCLNPGQPQNSAPGGLMKKLALTAVNQKGEAVLTKGMAEFAA